MKRKEVKIDSGKWEENCLDFSLEKKIKEYKEGIDYEVDKTGNFYTILSERLKKIIWPDDSFHYEAVVAIDRQGKIEGWRIQADNPREPYEKVVKGGLEEIMDDFEKGGKVVDGFQEVDKSFNQFQKKHEITNNRGSNIFLIIGVALLLAFSLLFYRFILKKG